MIAVSTLAMVFAVSSSLLLFSAHHHRERGTPCHVHTQNRPRPPAARMHRTEDRPARPPAPPAECKGPVFRAGADGNTQVVFEQCPPRPFAHR